jgi:hypothetical protein
MKLVSLLLLQVLLVQAAVAAPGEGEPGDVLQGLERVYVQVDYVCEEVTDAGLQDNDLLIQLADGIRDAGLLVLSSDPEAPTGPLVVLTVDSVVLPAGETVLHGALEVREVVTLARRPTVMTFGSVWCASVLVFAEPGNVADRSREVVDELTSSLLTDLAGVGS